MSTQCKYTKQANKLLAAMGVEFSAEFVKHGKHFTDDTETRDIYRLTLKRGSREVSFDFGQSTANSYYPDGEAALKHWFNMHPFAGKVSVDDGRAIKACGVPSMSLEDCRKVARGNRQFSFGIAPTAYDLLAGLTKYSPYDFESFCSEFGYDTDSRKAEATYRAVVDEWCKVSAFFTAEELGKLQEVQ